MKNKKGKNINSFDKLFESLVDAFLKIPNIDLINIDSTANKLFTTVCTRIADLSSFKELVLSHYIPETNKAIVSTMNQIRSSKYGSLLNLSRAEFDESLFQTIRLSYVALFHKLESYVTDIPSMADLLIDNRTAESCEKYAKKKFGFSLKDWQLFWVTYRINWIANCEKHYDGYPKKTPRPYLCERYPESSRLKLYPEEFKRDAEMLLKFYPVYLQIFFGIAQLKMHEDSFDRNEWQDSPEIIRIHDESVSEIESTIKKVITKLKSIAVGED